MIRHLVTCALTGAVVALSLAADPAWAKSDKKDDLKGETQRFSIPEFDARWWGRSRWC